MKTRSQSQQTKVNYCYRSSLQNQLFPTALALSVEQTVVSEMYHQIMVYLLKSLIIIELKMAKKSMPTGNICLNLRKFFFNTTPDGQVKQKYC